MRLQLRIPVSLFWLLAASAAAAERPDILMLSTPSRWLRAMRSRWPTSVWNWCTSELHVRVEGAPVRFEQLTVHELRSVWKCASG